MSRQVSLPGEAGGRVERGSGTTGQLPAHRQEPTAEWASQKVEGLLPF